MRTRELIKKEVLYTQKIENIENFSQNQNNFFHLTYIIFPAFPIKRQICIKMKVFCKREEGDYLIIARNNLRNEIVKLRERYFQ